MAQKQSKQIDKTALGAIDNIEWSHEDDVRVYIKELKSRGYRIVGLEQHPDSVALSNYKFNSDMALLLGREVEGIDEQLINLCDDIVEIPLIGKKESLNVIQAAAIAIYDLTNK